MQVCVILEECHGWKLYGTTVVSTYITPKLYNWRKRNQAKTTNSNAYNTNPHTGLDS